MSVPWILPPAWVWARFGDVADICSNLVDPSEFSEYPHIAPNHIESWTGRLLPHTTIAEDKVISGKHKFYPGQILYSKIRPYLAKAARVDFAGLCSADMYPISAKIDSGYLHRWMLTPQFTEAASGHQGRTVLPKINQQALVTVLVPLAPQLEQARIARKLERLIERSSAAKSSLEAVPGLIDRQRKSILAAAFRGDLTADWRARNPDVEPADKLLERIRAERRRRWEAAELARLTAKGKPPTDDRWKEYYKPIELHPTDELPQLPSGWAWSTVDELSVFVTDGTHQPPATTASGIPFIGIRNILNGRIDWNSVDRWVASETHQALTSRYRAKRGDTLYATVGATFGQAVLVEDDRDFVFQRHIAHLRVWPSIPSSYLTGCLSSPFCFEQAKRQARGAAQPTVNLSDLRSFVIPLPPFDEQEVIVGRLAETQRRVEKLEEMLSQVTTTSVHLEKTILARAFRGELVPQDPNDEPASVLLERLRAEIAAAPAKPGRRARASALADDAPPEPRPAVPRPRRAAAAPAPSAPQTSATAPSPVVPPAPAPRAGQQPLPLAVPAVDFLGLPADTQAERVHAVLLGEGPIEREDAVRRAADGLRDAGLAAFQRLRRDGPLAACIDAAISVGLREGRFDRPARGSVRAVASEPADVPSPLWRRALLAALGSPQAADEAVRAAVDWCQAQFGLDFKRLRTGGHIDTALRAALAELRAAGEVVEDRSGTLSVRARNA